MKKHILFLFTLIAINSGLLKAQILIPQLQAGVYVNDTINSVGFPFTAYCDSLNQNYCSFTINPDLTPIVTGVDLMYIVYSVPPLPDSAYTLETGILQVGDTLLFNSPIQQYHLICTTPCYVTFLLIISGTPTIPFEVYPCELYMMETNAECGNGFFTEGVSWLSCSVSDFTGLNKLPTSNKIVISLSPNSDDLNIHYSSPILSESVFKLFNYQGREILSEKLPVNFLSGNYSTEKLTNGTYIWKISDKFGRMQSGKLAINK